MSTPSLRASGQNECGSGNYRRHHAAVSRRAVSDRLLSTAFNVGSGSGPPGSRRALNVRSQTQSCRSEPAAGRRPGPGATRQVSVRVPDRAQSGPGGEGRRLLPESVGHNRPFLILQSCPSRIEPGRENPATRAGSPRRWPGSDRRRVRCQRVRRRLKPRPARPSPRRASVAGSGTEAGGTGANFNVEVILKLDSDVCRSAKKMSSEYSCSLRGPLPTATPPKRNSMRRCAPRRGP